MQAMAGDVLTMRKWVTFFGILTIVAMALAVLPWLLLVVALGS